MDNLFFYFALQSNCSLRVNQGSQIGVQDSEGKGERE